MSRRSVRATADGCRPGRLVQLRYRPFGLPQWFATRAGRLAHDVMVRKHLLGIARRVEAAAPHTPTVSACEIVSA